MKNPQLVNNETYHIVIRGVAGSVIFEDNDDYYRGIFSLYEFNDTRTVIIRERRSARLNFKRINKNLASVISPDGRNRLVEILAFSFMPNHIHLLVRQIKDNGITQFMRKVGTGYANYFNKKYKRKGHLFQGRFLAVHIKTNKQLQNVFVYIHTNPISLIEPGWKEEGVVNSEKAIKFLKNYKWSSYADYIGEKSFPSVTNRDFLSEIMSGKQGCREAVESWIKYKKEMKDFNSVILE